MTTDVVKQIYNLPETALPSIATTVLAEPVSATTSLSVQPIGQGGGQATLGIYRVNGIASTAKGERKWSAVVKAIGAGGNAFQNMDFDGLKEPLVYRDRVFAKLCGRVRAARCYAIQIHGAMQFLWLEDLSDAPQPPWEVDQFIECANHLGQFNAHWPEQSLPDWEWLNHISMREFFRMRRFNEALTQLLAMPNDPFVRRIAPPDIREALARFWGETDSLLLLTEDAPKGICHGNCHSRNLFPMSDANGSYTVAIDWVKVGVNPYAEDIGHLLGSAISWNDLSIDQARKIVDPLFDAYIDGLKDAGWSGDEERVRLTYFTRLACDAFRTVNILMLAIENIDFRLGVEKTFNSSFETLCDRRAEMLGFYLDCKNQALRLANRF